MEGKIKVDAVELLYNLYRMFKEEYDVEIEKSVLDEKIMQRLADVVMRVFDDEKYRKEGLYLRKRSSEVIDLTFKDKVDEIVLEKNPYVRDTNHRLLNFADARKSLFVHVEITNQYFFEWLKYTIIFPASIIELVADENKIKLSEEYDEDDYNEEKVLYELL
jgi:hypothetical protein